jgi:hypothetical protein
MTLPDSVDPAGLLETGGPAALREALTSAVRPLADLVTDSRIDDWARGRELVFTELQIGALRAAATAIANMPGDHVGPQAARLCALFSETYGWTPQEVTTEIIDTIERRLTSAQARPMQGGPWHPADSPWAVVTRATAPPRQRTPADLATITQPPALRLLQSQSAQRDTLRDHAGLTPSYRSRGPAALRRAARLTRASRSGAAGRILITTSVGWMEDGI